MRRASVCAGSDLARLMVTLGIGLMLYKPRTQGGVHHRRVDGLSGVTSGSSWVFPFDLAGSTAISTASRCCRGVRPGPPHRHRPSAVAARIREKRQAHAAIACRSGAGLSPSTPPAQRWRHRRRAARADHAVVASDTLGFPRSPTDDHAGAGGTGRLYGGSRGRGIVFMIAHHTLST